MKHFSFLFLLALCVALWQCSDRAKESVSEQAKITVADLPESYFFLFDSLDLLRDAPIARLLANALANEPKPLEFSRQISSGWRYAPGDPQHGLSVAYAQLPELDTLVQLPHRVNRPDWPLWYEQKLAAPQAAYLYADGDDGLQCFVNGELQRPVYGNFFLLPAGADSLTLTLRVLNNAMSGGLRSAALLSPEALQQFLRERELAGLSAQLVFLANRYRNELDSARWEGLDRALLSKNADVLRSAVAGFQPLKLPLLNKLPQTTGAGQAFSFSAWGDSQGGWRTFSRLVEHMAARPDSFSIGLGDLVADGIDENQWRAFVQCLQPLLEKGRVFPVAGNHDYDGYYNTLNPLLYKTYVLNDPDRPTYFSWVYQNAYFLALDPNERFPLGIAGEQRAWMLEQMNSPEWRQADWRFILLHQPPYAQGWPGYHGDAFIRNLVDSLAESKGIDFVLSGHSHDYERLSKTYGRQKTHFLVLGGGGGGLEPPESSDFPKMDKVIKQHHYAHFNMSPKQVEINIYNMEDQLLDRVLVVH